MHVGLNSTSKDVEDSILRILRNKNNLPQQVIREMPRLGAEDVALQLSPSLGC